MEKVATPEWAEEGDAEPCFVFVKELTAKERDAWEVFVNAKGEGLEDDAAKQARMANFSASLCAATICDESGATLFTLGDVDALGEVGCGPLKRCYKAATRLNGMDGDKEDLEKNSDSAPAGSSPTDSQPN